MILADILFLLGALLWDGATPTTPVTIVAEAPYPGALGLSCDPGFRQIPGNAQASCPEGFAGIVLYDRALQSREMLLNVLAHESYHLDHIEAGRPSDPFHEAEAYRAGCDYSPVPMCEAWLRTYPLP